MAGSTTPRSARLTETIRVRVDADDLRKIDEARQGLGLRSRSAAVRAMLDVADQAAAGGATAPPRPAVPDASLLPLVTELRRIGVNVNQVARVAHTTGLSLSSARSLTQAAIDLREVADTLDEITFRLGDGDAA